MLDRSSLVFPVLVFAGSICMLRIDEIVGFMQGLCAISLEAYVIACLRCESKPRATHIKYYLAAALHRLPRDLGSTFHVGLAEQSLLHP